MIHDIDMAALNADLLKDARTAVEQAAVLYPVDITAGMRAQEVWRSGPHEEISLNPISLTSRRPFSWLLNTFHFRRDCSTGWAFPRSENGYFAALHNYASLSVYMGGAQLSLDSGRLDLWIKSLVFGVSSRYIWRINPFQIKYYVAALKEYHIVHATPITVFEDRHIMQIVQGATILATGVRGDESLIWVHVFRYWRRTEAVHSLRIRYHSCY